MQYVLAQYKTMDSKMTTEISIVFRSQWNVSSFPGHSGKLLFEKTIPLILR